MSARIAYRSYAKINLYLDVLSRRPDGFHDLETLFQSVSLFDEISFEERPGGLELTGSLDGLGPAESNLAVRAARLVQEHAGVDRGVAIHLDKRIPVAAGLAGGSGNAAATLVALNDLWDLRMPRERLLELALALGSDVPFCLVGGYAAATGRGEVLTPLPPVHPPRWFVLIHPEVAVSTPAVFQHPALIRNDAPRVDGRTAAFARIVQREQLARGPLPVDSATMFYNRMAPVTFALHPELAVWQQRLLEAGCPAAGMSGSGPTMVGLCMDEDGARRIAESFPEVRVSVVHDVPCGVEVAA